MAGDASCAWEKHVDEDSGAAYYYNPSTGESSWEVPEGFTSPREQDTEQKQPPKWRKFKDDESGTIYYYDEVSGTSRWEKPEDFEEKQEEVHTDQDPKETKHQEEPEDTANETEVVKDKEKQTSVESGGQKEKTGGSSASTAPARWIKYVDAASGKPYYHNTSTGKTQWEQPEDFDEAAAPAGQQMSAEYQAHLNRMRTERLSRVTQQVLDPSGNLSKLNAILSGIDGKGASKAAPIGDDTSAAKAPKAEWQQHIDAQTQRYYYHNVVTGVTQWNKPDAPIVSGLADWIPPAVPEADDDGGRGKTVSGVNYVAQAKFNRLTGKYEQLGGDEYWETVGMATDRAGRQMSAFFDINELEKNREEAKRRKEQLKRKHIDWKKISAEKKAKKQKQKNEWLFTD